MPMYNLLEYSSNYSETTGSFIQKMKQLILMQMLQIVMILNILSIKLNYWKTQLLNPFKIMPIEL